MKQQATSSLTASFAVRIGGPLSALMMVSACGVAERMQTNARFSKLWENMDYSQKCAGGYEKQRTIGGTVKVCVDKLPNAHTQYNYDPQDMR